MGQLKSYLQGNKESLDAGTISYALTSLHPNHWFIAVFNNPGRAAFFGLKSKFEKSKVPVLQASYFHQFLSYEHNFW